MAVHLAEAACRGIPVELFVDGIEVVHHDDIALRCQVLLGGVFDKASSSLAPTQHYLSVTFFFVTTTLLLLAFKVVARFVAVLVAIVRCHRVLGTALATNHIEL